MAYTLKAVTLRTNNSVEGMARIDELWNDITSGKLPVLFDSTHTFQQGISPISRYSNYSSDETGAYDLSILGVSADFFQELERKVAGGSYKKYETEHENGDLSACARTAWERVWAEQKAGTIDRAFTNDYESTVPREYAKDGKAHCYLYIAVHNGTTDYKG